MHNCPDVKGLIIGIAEEYSFHNNSLNDASNWGEAEHIFNTHVYPYLVYGNSDYQEKRVKFIHELIAARARRISEVSPGRNDVDNWLTAQKEMAVEIYRIYQASEERSEIIKTLKKQIDGQLEPLKKYHNL